MTFQMQRNVTLVGAITIMLLLVVIVGISWCQLAIDTDPDYLSYNGQRILLIGETANDINHRKHANPTDFDLTYFSRLVEYGNHTFMWLRDSYERVDPASLENIGNNTGYWNKVRAIALEAKRHNIILGVIVFSYSVFYDNSPHYTGEWKNAFEYQYVHSNGHRGWLDYGNGFFDVNSSDPAIRKVISIQQSMLKQLIYAVRDCPNVYIVPMWESGAKLATRQANHGLWHRWFVQQCKDYEMLFGSVPHLYAIEMTLTASKARDWDYDFLVDEDGNALKQPGLPYVQLSSDSWLRGNVPTWPADERWNWPDIEDQWNGLCQRPDGKCEPVRNLYFMEWCVTTWKVAGVASMWVADAMEQQKMRELMERFNGSTPEPIEPEPIEPDEPELTDVNISVVGLNAKESTFDVGKEMYLDRNYQYTVIPSEFWGAKALKTVNAHKVFPVENGLQFRIDKQATVYVGYDTRLDRPGWLSGWYDTKEHVYCNQIEGKNKYRVYSREFQAGMVTLGFNHGISSSNMYVVFVK